MFITLKKDAFEFRILKTWSTNSSKSDVLGGRGGKTVKYILDLFFPQSKIHNMF